MKCYILPPENDANAIGAQYPPTCHEEATMNQPISTTHNHGFTLIELSIVLVIIGIILASVMKGRDLVYSAKETKVEQTFFLKWQTILNDYYKATGYALGDGTINGGVDAAVDSFADYITFDEVSTNPDPDMGLTRRTRIKTALRAAGIDPCNLISSNVYGDDSKPKCANGMDIFSYRVDSENVGHREVTIGLGHLFIIRGNRKDNAQDEKLQPRLGLRNVLVFYDMPLDYAKRLDTTIDGAALGDEGRCLNLTYWNNDARYQFGLKDPYAASGGDGEAIAKYFLWPEDKQRRAIYARPWPSPQNIVTVTTYPILDRYFVVGVILDY